MIAFRTALLGCTLFLSACGNSSSDAAPATTSGAATGTAAASGQPQGGKKSAVVGFCLGADGNSQDCGIACNTAKDEASCAKWATLTKAICAKITKAQCQEICEKDQNPTACEIAKTMK